MLVDTENLATADDFRKDVERFVSNMREGRGHVAITSDSEVVGIFMSIAEYEVLRGAAVRLLLNSREKGEVVSHEVVRKRAEQFLERRTNQ